METILIRVFGFAGPRFDDSDDDSDDKEFNSIHFPNYTIEVIDDIRKVNAAVQKLRR